MNLAAEIDPKALTDALRTATTELRMLEPAPCWTYGPYQGVFAAGVHTALPALGPRQYVALDPGSATFYTGLPVDPAGTTEAHRAANLVDRWDELHSFLEGHFVAVRVHRDGPTAAEVVVDPLGLEQAYVVDVAGGTLLSNSVRVLDHAARLTGLDPVGLSLLVSTGWVGSDRTLRASVRVLRGGQRLRWVRGGREPSESNYFSSRQLMTRQSWRLRSTAADLLCENLVSAVRTLDAQFGEIECPLTGGRDTRLLAGLMLASEASHGYYTVGHPASGDVVVAQRLAQELGLRHRVVVATDEDVIKGWDASVARLVAVTDGLVSVKELGGPPVHVDRLSVHLHGFGGEVARSLMGPRQLVDVRLPRAVERLQADWVKNGSGLVTGNGIELATASVKSFIDRRLDDGIRVDDLPDHFYTFDRLPRWGGSAMRQRADQVDYFQPLCTRAFITTAFSIRTLSRYAEPLHYELLLRLEPRLHAFPFAAARQWRSQTTVGTLAGAAARILSRRFSRRGRIPSTSPAGGGSVFQKHLWLEGAIDHVRDACLAVTDPVFQDIVDRHRLERLLSPATEPRTRKEHWRTILAIATAAYYSASSD